MIQQLNEEYSQLLGSTIEYLSVEAYNGRLGSIFAPHLNESKAFALPVLILSNFARYNTSILLEQLLQLRGPKPFLQILQYKQFCQKANTQSDPIKNFCNKKKKKKPEIILKIILKPHQPQNIRRPNILMMNISTPCILNDGDNTDPALIRVSTKFYLKFYGICYY